MTDISQPSAIGSAGLLRIAALPASTWLAGGSTGLFDRLRVLEARTAEYHARTRDLAEEIGQRLVPHAAVDGRGRASALRVRRCLHNGSTTLPANAARVAELAGRVLPDTGLAATLLEVIEAAGALRSLRHELEMAVVAEEERLLALPWQLLHENAAGQHAVHDGDIAIYNDIARRVAAGEPWTTKRMRQRSDYLWRMITRGATRATPRGWLAHVALVMVAECHGWTGHDILRVRDQSATEVAENLDLRRTVDGTAEALLGDPSATVGLAPLALPEADQLVVWTLDGASRTRLTETRMRRSPALNALITALAQGPRPVGGLLDTLTMPGTHSRPALSGLVAHLVRLQALQVSAPPRHEIVTWRPLTAAPAATRARPHDGRLTTSSDDYLDVYRQAGTAIASSHAARLSALARQALRIAALIHADGPLVPSVPSSAGQLSAEPRRLLDITAECVRSLPDSPPAIRRPNEWPPVRQAESGYAGLVRWLADRFDGAGSIDLDDGDLDPIEAPHPEIDWPLDCLLRPVRGAGGELAVLDQFIPAGVYDARFVPALTELDGEPPQASAYRKFLTRFEEMAATRFVEILAPPLNKQGANAVRRPAYTGLWTGDPDRSAYLRDGRARYLPLSAITLRACGGRVIAEAAGEPIWPILHTARVPVPPWDTIIALLLLASPQPSRIRWRAPSHSLRAWPERNFVPRITVGGGLILSPAQWRLDRREFWHPGDRLPDKLAALDRIRRGHRLPRLVSASASAHDEPLAVDLSSLHGLRALERLLQRDASALELAELFAEPEQLTVHDEAAADGGPSVAELLLRLPVDAAPAALARRCARWAHVPRGQPAASSTASARVAATVRREIP